MIFDVRSSLFIQIPREMNVREIAEKKIQLASRSRGSAATRALRASFQRRDGKRRDGTFSRASDVPADNGVYQRNAMSIRHHRERKSETHFSAIRPPRALSGREARRSRVKIRVAQLPSLTEADGIATPSLPSTPRIAG